MGFFEEGGLRSLLVFTLIAMTAAVLLAIFFPVLGVFAGFVFIGLIYLRFIYRYLRSLRGYQDHYTSTGQDSLNAQYVVRLVIVGVIYVVVLLVVENFLNNLPLSILITTIPFAIIISVVDQYAGREMREYLATKRKEHSDFVDSLGKGEGKCMSCQRKLDQNATDCPHCGFKQKQITPDSDYIAKR